MLKSYVLRERTGYWPASHLVIKSRSLDKGRVESGYELISPRPADGHRNDCTAILIAAMLDARFVERWASARKDVQSQTVVVICFASADQC